MTRHSTLDIRVGLQEQLDASGHLLDGWSVGTVTRTGPWSMLVSLAPDAGPGVLIEWHETTDEAVEAFVRGPRFAVAYRSRPDTWDVDAAETPEDVRRMTAFICQALSQIADGFELTEPKPSKDAREEILTSRAFQDWLSPTLSLGDVVGDGWSLDDVSEFGPEELALTFTRDNEGDADPEMTRLKIRVRDNERPAAVRVGQLDILYRVPFGESAAQSNQGDPTHALAVELGHYLDAGERTIRWATPPRPSTGGPRAADDATPKAINLALPGPCYQRCVFCAVREEIDPVSSASEQYVERLRTDVIESARRGTRVLRVNGLEPLRAPFAYELLDLARNKGFNEFHILSTFLPCADPEEAKRLFDALPERYSFYVPIYGSHAEVHDRVTGLPGSFEDLLKAVCNLRRLMEEERREKGEDARKGTLIFTTVIVSQNVHDLVGMRDLVRPWADWWEVHMAFPNTSSRRDRYRDVALPMQQVLEAVYPKGWYCVADLELGEILPCMAYHHQVDTGHALLTPRRIRERKLEPSGTYYETIGFTHSMGEGKPIAFTSATVPCPHQTTCSLFGICPGKVYRAYDELFGCDELRPVSIEELRELPDGEEIATLVQEVSRTPARAKNP